MTTRGVLYVHSAPRALCPHVEWAIAGVLGTRVSLDWIHQPASPGTWRSEFSWQGQAGTASKLASALRGWQMLRFEVTEDLIMAAVARTVELGWIKKGDRVGVTAGLPSGKPGTTSLLQIQEA